MRNISFMLTTQQFRDRTKTVTRRLGWSNLKPGTRLMGCEKCQGIKPGEKMVKLGEIEVVSVTQTRLDTITQDDCIREGFPRYTPADFVAMFCREMGVEPDCIVNRIEFKHVGGIDEEIS